MNDNSLVQLQQKAGNKKQLEAKLRELQEQRRVYDREIVSLQVAYEREQDKLECRSLANYFFHVIGKMDDKLSKERREAYAAKVKLDAAVQELDAVEYDIKEIQRQISEIREFEAQYQERFEQKRKELYASGTPVADQILEMEQAIGSLETQKKEIREAIAAGHSALGIADRILSELDDADGWNTWDLIGGGGIITHMAKHSHLDGAQDLVQELQRKLRQFKTELADIQVNAELQVNIDGFLRFADYFFDGLFADWAVGDRISQSMSSVQNTKSQINSMIAKLREMETAADREIRGLNFQLENLIVKA